ncbi:MAG: hypothetical protein JW862_17070 [Anaerolineales bacterium]|nr:hypothetical protein [Anaerolineales bacterium]
MSTCGGNKSISKQLVWLLRIGLPVLLAATGLWLLSAVSPVEAGQKGVQATHTVCASGCDFPTLTAAIAAADPGDTLELAAETFTETVTIDKDLILSGAGAEWTIIQAASERSLASTRVITVTPGVSVSLQALQVTHGNQLAGMGGGILNQGWLSLEQVLVDDNFAVRGSAIANHASQEGVPVYLEVHHATIRNNAGSPNILNFAQNADANLILSDVVIHNNSGCGVLNEGAVGMAFATLTDIVITEQFNSHTGTYASAITNLNESTSTSLSHSWIEDNYADWAGAIYNAGSLLVEETTLLDNRGDMGGAIHNVGSLLVRASLLQGNRADYGGGIFARNNSVTTIERSAIVDNQADDGGGIQVEVTAPGYTGTMTITQSSIANNRAEYSAGGIYAFAQQGHLDLTILESSIFGNANGTYTWDTGGGLSIRTGTTSYQPGSSRVTVINTTISGNRANWLGGGISQSAGWGRAILALQQVTISGNQASVGAGLYSYGSQETGQAVVVLHQTILADSLLGEDCAVEGFATLVDGGYNLVEDNSCGFSGGVDPQLRPLADRGGWTWTQIPYSGSPIIDAVPAAACVSDRDQRGIARPQGAGCDIGAVEYERHYPAEIYFPGLHK